MLLGHSQVQDVCWHIEFNKYLDWFEFISYDQSTTLVIIIGFLDPTLDLNFKETTLSIWLNILNFISQHRFSVNLTHVWQHSALSDITQKCLPIIVIQEVFMSLLLTIRVNILTLSHINWIVLHIHTGICHPPKNPCKRLTSLTESHSDFSDHQRAPSDMLKLKHTHSRYCPRLFTCFRDGGVCLTVIQKRHFNSHR